MPPALDVGAGVKKTVRVLVLKRQPPLFVDVMVRVTAPLVMSDALGI